MAGGKINFDMGKYFGDKRFVWQRLKYVGRYITIYT